MRLGCHGLRPDVASNNNKKSWNQCVTHESMEELTMCFEFEWLYWAQLAQEREREENEKARQTRETVPQPAPTREQQERPVPAHA
jgi:hypothetical protein